MSDSHADPHDADARLREAELALAGSRDFTSAVLDTVGAYVVVLDAHGTVLRVNAAMRELLDGDAELVGRNVTAPDDIVPPHRLDEVRAAFHAMCAGQLHDFQVDLHRPDGTIRRVLWNTTVHRDPDGTLRTVIGTGIDVTAQRELEERLAERDRLDTIGRLATGIAHDFGNTLWALRMRIDRMRGRGDPASTSDLEAMVRAVDHAHALIADLLEYRRGVDRAAAPIAVDDHALDAMAVVRDAVRPTVKIVVATDAAGARVLVDPGRLERLVVNLCTNASDAMPDGGELTVSTSVAEPDEPLMPGGVRGERFAPGRVVRLVVADSGVGIPPDHLPHVFEPYFTTKPPARGTGLGLAGVFGAVAQARGDIRVTSRPDQGTTFEVWLPEYAAPPAGGTSGA